MANNYSLFSETIEEVPTEGIKWARSVLMNYDDRDEAGLHALRLDLDTDDPLDNWPGFSCSIESDSLWLYAEEGYDEDMLVLFVQALIKKFIPDLVFGMSVANTCSSKRVNEFGGSWLVITKNEVMGGSTWGEVKLRVEALKTGDVGPGAD